MRVEALMGKKHGARLSVLKPGMASSSASFASRGNPMVTEREAIRDYGRNPDIENADFDADRQRFRRLVDKELDAALSHKDSADIGQFTRANFNKDSDKGSLFAKGVHWRDWKKQPAFEVEIKPKGRSKAELLRRRANIGASMHKALHAVEGQKLREAADDLIGCPNGCGYVHTDSRMVARHVRQYPSACCTHLHCNCLDCKRSRNEI
jgi:hypothetical protein